MVDMPKRKPPTTSSELHKVNILAENIWLEFFFTLNNYLTNVKESIQPYYLPITGE